MTHTSCRSCQAPLPPPFLSLGMQPLANNLLSSPNERHTLSPLALTKCASCQLVQTTGVVAPDLLFRHYLYTPSQSSSFRNHFRGLADALWDRFSLAAEDLVLDIASNDGLLLSYFKENGCRVIGVDPAQNLAADAASRGIPTLPHYFDQDVAKAIWYQYGRPRIITATNVVAHVDDVLSFFYAVRGLLADDGVFVIEVPYLRDMIEQGTCDLIYFEHLSYWTVATLHAALRRSGLQLFDVELISTHGGSIRAYAQTLSPLPPHRITDLALRLPVEEQIDPDAYAHLEARLQLVRHELVSLVQQHHGSIAGYTAPAKTTTLLNYCGLTSDDIPWIMDDALLKQGRYIPGTGIPIVGLEYIKEDPKPILLLGAWNLADELIAKLSGLCEQVLLPFPRPHLVPVPFLPTSPAPQP